MFNLQPLAPSKEQRMSSSSSLPAPIPTPDPGTSYNPTLVEHQALLRKALQIAEQEEQTTAPLRDLKKRLTDAASKGKAAEAWEHAEAEVGSGEEDAGGVSREASGEAATEQKRKKAKSAKEKKKALANRRLEV